MEGKKKEKKRQKLLKRIHRELVGIRITMEVEKAHIEKLLGYMSELKEMTDEHEFEAIMYDVNAAMEELGIFLSAIPKESNNEEHRPEIA